MRLCDVLCVVTLWLFNSLKEWIIVCIFCLSHMYYYNINCRLIPLYAKIFMFSVNKTHNWRNWGLVRLKHSSMEKEMAPHSSTLAWKIPWTEEPSMLQSMGSQSRTWLSDFTYFLTILPPNLGLVLKINILSDFPQCFTWKISFWFIFNIIKILYLKKRKSTCPWISLISVRAVIGTQSVLFQRPWSYHHKIPPPRLCPKMPYIFPLLNAL